MLQSLLLSFNNIHQNMCTINYSLTFWDFGIRENLDINKIKLYLAALVSMCKLWQNTYAIAINSLLDIKISAKQKIRHQVVYLL